MSVKTLNDIIRKKLLAKVADFYARTLSNDKKALAFLKVQGFAEPSLLETFNAGFCNGTLHTTLPKSGEIVDQLKTVGVLNTKKEERFLNRIVVPVCDETGEVVDLFGRSLKSCEPDIFLSPDARGVFNSQALGAAQGNVIITRDIFEALSLWSAGLNNVVSLYGSWQPEEYQSILSASSKTNADKTESITLTDAGFDIVINGRCYQLCAIEQPAPSRLKATIKVLADGKTSKLAQFYIDTVDFYLSRSRKRFTTEAANLLKELPHVFEADLNRIMLAVEDYLKERLAEQSGTSISISEADRKEGTKLGKSRNLVKQIQSDLGNLGIIGENTNRLLLYLAMTSRKTDDPLAVQILSSSGAGKSHLQDAVLSLCPSEDLLKLTSLTGQALFYKGEDSLKHKCLSIAEVAGAQGARYALRNLISDKKLSIESTVKNALTGKLETQINVVNGPTAVFETTTQPDTDAETKSRYLLLSVDESPKQTGAILAAQRQSHTLEGRKRKAAKENVLSRHHAFQRMLEPVAVVNPYEPLLAYGDDRLAFRRDHPKYLNLILAVTFLHQMQRPRKHDMELGEYIETTLEDISIANTIACQLFGQSLDELSFPSRQLLRMIGDYVQKRAEHAECDPLQVEFTRRELREAIQWTEARLRLHLTELIRLEYVGSVSGRFGQRYCHRLLIKPDEIESAGRFVPGLKSIERLREEANLAGINNHLAATSQQRSCEVSKRVKRSPATRKTRRKANLAAR